MDVSTAIYHGIRQNVRRVLIALGPERIEKGLTAFDDGSSNWSQCFFARAFQDEAQLGNPSYELMKKYPHPRGHFFDPTDHICLLLDDPKCKLRLAVKLTWNAFDGNAGKHWTRSELKQFIEDVLDESRPAEVIQLIRSLADAKITEDTPVACF